MAQAQALLAIATPDHRQTATACLTRALALVPPLDLAKRLRQTHSRLARQMLCAKAAGHRQATAAAGKPPRPQ